MRGFLIIAGFICAWVTLYNGIVAFGAPPVRDDELVTMSGIVRHIDTPLARNRLVEQFVIELEVPPVRLVKIPVPTAFLPLDAARSLVGRTVTITVAGKRSRNRWLYALTRDDDGREIIRLNATRAHDAALRASHVRWMLAMGAVAGVIFMLALYRRPSP